MRAESWIDALSQLRPGAPDVTRADAPLTQRVAAARHLGRYGPSREAEASLLAALTATPAPPTALREAILLALTRRASQRSSLPLIRWLQEQDPPPSGALRVLAAIGDRPAVGFLLRALQDSDTAAQAEEALQRLDEPKVVPWLLSGLHYLEGAARPAAIRILGQLRDPRARRPLQALLEDPAAPVRAAAAQALGDLRDGRSADLLLARAGDEAPEVRLAAMAALAHVGHGGHAQQLRRELASDEAPSAQALSTLCALDAPGCSGWLRSALEQARSRSIAQQILFDTPHPAWVGLLQQQLRHSTSVEAAASALGRVARGEGLQTLVSVMEAQPDRAAAAARGLAIGLRLHSPTGELRRRAQALLNKLPAERRLALLALAREPAVAPQLGDALGADSARRRALGAFGLQLLGSAHGQERALARALSVEDDPEAFRRQATAALALGLRTRLAPLWPWLRRDDTAPEAMWLAARAAPGHRELRIVLRDALRTRARRPARVRSGAAIALALMPDATAVPALIAALDDPSDRVRVSAIRALGALGGPQAAAALRQHARVELRQALRGATREAAQAALGKRAYSLLLRGSHVLELRVNDAAEQTRPLLDVQLPDSRWLRIQSDADGALSLPDLPGGHADILRVDGPPGR